MEATKILRANKYEGLIIGVTGNSTPFFAVLPFNSFLIWLSGSAMDSEVQEFLNSGAGKSTIF